MLKPHVFQQPCVATRNLPYINLDGPLNAGFSNGGVIGTGQVVWLEESTARKIGSTAANAFVEGIGVVSIDARWLTKTEIETAQPMRASESLADLSLPVQPVHGAILSASQLSRR